MKTIANHTLKRSPKMYTRTPRASLASIQPDAPKTSTVYKAILKYGFTSKKPLKRPYITAQRRVSWAKDNRKHKKW